VTGTPITMAAAIAPGIVLPHGMQALLETFRCVGGGPKDQTPESI